ncbi:MAG TPA: DUF4870 domain-containing protein [Ktedonobacterales bacterium]|nr:DUF4870 domain-containing protein [Ktedonobacterales bacterium]
MTTPPQQPPYGQQPYGQPGYEPPSGNAPGYGPQGYVPPPPPQGTTGQWGPSSIGMEPSVSAGLGYLISIVAIIFFFMEKQNRFVRFHNAQAILLHVIYLICFGVWLAAFFAIIGVSATADPATADTIAGLGLVLMTLCIGVVVLLYLVLWIWGMIAAFSGRLVKFPLIGALAERWAGGPIVPVASGPTIPFGPPPAY